MKNILNICYALIFILSIALNFSKTSDFNSSEMMELSQLELAATVASAEDPFCPNGCVDYGAGCFCHFWFPDYHEYDW